MSDKFGTSSDVKTVVHGGYEWSVKDEGVCAPMSWTINPGLSLRDYLAGQIVGTLLAHMPEAPNRTIARQAYQLADEMIMARETK